MNTLIFASLVLTVITFVLASLVLTMIFLAARRRRRRAPAAHLPPLLEETELAVVPSFSDVDNDGFAVVPSVATTALEEDDLVSMFSDMCLVPRAQQHSSAHYDRATEEDQVVPYAVAPYANDDAFRTDYAYVDNDDAVVPGSWASSLYAVVPVPNLFSNDDAVVPQEVYL